MTDNCSKSGEISEIKTILTSIVKEFYGNGQKGIAREFPELRSSVENLTLTIAAQTKVISDLVEFQTSFNAIDKFKKDHGVTTRGRAAIIITVIFGLCSIGCTLIIKYG